MSTLAVTIAAVAAGWLGAFFLYDRVLRRRWLGRFKRGFFISLLAALTGMALMSASVVGVWGYQAAKRMLDLQLASQLQDIGGVVETQISGGIDNVKTGLGGFGDTLVPQLTQPNGLAEISKRMEFLRAVTPAFLQLSLFDESGRLLTSTAPSATREEPSRVAVAFCLDGKPFVSEPQLSEQHKRQLILVSAPARDAKGHVSAVLVAWFDLHTELSALVKLAKFNKSGRAVVVDGDGQIIAHPNPARINDDVSSYEPVKRARASDQAGSVVARNLEGVDRLFAYRRIKNPATLASFPWILLTEIDAQEMLAPLRELQVELGLGLALVLCGVLFVAVQLTRSIEGPIQTLGTFARKIGTGDLGDRMPFGGHDLAGELAATLNTMADGLAERDRVKEVFGRYVATQVSDKILTGQANLGGESRYVTILFSDIRNFTSTAEKMTPVQVVKFLNDYFSEMVDAVFEHNGMLDKFMGDGLMAVFGVFGEAGDHPRQAVLAGLRMKALLAKINGERSVAGKAPIAIGIGIHSAEVIVGNIGSRRRLEFTVVGDGVNVSSRLQSLNKEFGTTMLISDTTRKALQDEFECRQMPSTSLRGREGEIGFYEVVSAHAAAGDEPRTERP